jgi:hypothetical protein
MGVPNYLCPQLFARWEMDWARLTSFREEWGVFAQPQRLS